MSAEEMPASAPGLVDGVADETVDATEGVDRAVDDADSPQGGAEPAERSGDRPEGELSLEELEAEIGRAEELHGELSRRLDAAGRD